MAENKNKYVSPGKLSVFLDNLKNIFSPLIHKHTISEIEDYIVDNELSSTSVNPVQNKVLDAEFEAVAKAMNVLDMAVDEKLAVFEETIDTTANAIRYDKRQELTEEQKAQAKFNIGAADINDIYEDTLCEFYYTWDGATDGIDTFTIALQDVDGNFVETSYYKVSNDVLTSDRRLIRNFNGVIVTLSNGDNYERNQENYINSFYEGVNCCSLAGFAIYGNDYLFDRSTILNGIYIIEKSGLCDFNGHSFTAPSEGVYFPVRSDGVYVTSLQLTASDKTGIYLNSSSKKFIVKVNNDGTLKTVDNDGNIAWDASNISENMTVPEFTDEDEGKFLSVKGGALSWEISGESNIRDNIITILEEREFSDFRLNDTLGYLTTSLDVLNVTIGETYIVMWDETEYEVVAENGDTFEDGGILLGNGTSVGLPGNGEPFAIGVSSTRVTYFALTDPSTSHKIAIYQMIKPIEIPNFTDADEGKVLSINNGVISWETVNADNDSEDFATGMYVQDNEPMDAPENSLWVDLDEPSSELTYVNSINGKTGSVMLSAEDIGALPDSIDIPDLTGYATEEYVDTAVSNVQVNLDGYATEDYVDKAVSNVQVDLTDYATKEEINTAVSSVQSVLEDYATKEYVDTTVSELSVENYDTNIRAINHRGYSSVAPENTIPAYILSKKNGFTYVEADVSFTSDGVPVLLHDSTIDRTSNGSGSVSLLTYAELLSYDFGSWKSANYTGTKIPSFEKFIKLCKLISLHPYIELKSNGSYTQEQIQGLVEMVRRYGMQGKVTWISFNPSYLTYVKTADPTSRLGYLVSSITENVITTVQGLKTETNEVFLDSSDYSLNAIELCSDSNIPLEVWTINDESTIRTLDEYITGVTSDNVIAGNVLNNYWENPDLWNYSDLTQDSNSPVIDINMNYGTNSTGLTQYNPSVMSNGSFSNGQFVVNGTGALTVPTDFMNGTGSWTIAFAIDGYTIKTTPNYCRVARGFNDVPSIFYQKSASAFLFKLANRTAFASELVWYDNTFMTPWGTSSSNALSFNIPTSSKTVFVFMNDGTHITMWVNGSMKAKALSTNYTSQYYASSFSIGDNQSKGYDMTSMKCSMLKAWNRALSEDEIASIV